MNAVFWLTWLASLLALVAGGISVMLTTHPHSLWQRHGAGELAIYVAVVSTIALVLMTALNGALQVALQL